MKICIFRERVNPSWYYYKDFCSAALSLVRSCKTQITILRLGFWVLIFFFLVTYITSISNEMLMWMKVCAWTKRYDTISSCRHGECNDARNVWWSSVGRWRPHPLFSRTNLDEVSLFFRNRFKLKIEISCSFKSLDIFTSVNRKRKVVN